MTSYERILTVVRGRVPDHIPVAPELFGVTARLNGYSIYQYVTDGKVIADSQVRLREEIGYDVVFAFADLSVEAEAIGCKLRYEKDAYPSVKEHVLKDITSVSELKKPDPNRDGRMPVVLEASARMRETLGNTCPIVACVMGPFSIASQIIGLENLLYLLVDNPDGVERLLDFTEEVATEYGLALIDAGAHAPVVFDPSASPAVIPHELFLKLEVPRLKRMFDRWKQVGVSIFWISIAGQTKKILPYFYKAGVNLATIDYVVTLSQARELTKEITLNGNLKSYLFINATPEVIKDEVYDCFKQIGDYPKYIVGSGCEVPVDAKIENIKALMDASLEFSERYIR